MPNLPGYSTTRDLARAALAKVRTVALCFIEVVTISAHGPVGR
ncbi:hypothetical protein [Pseudoclavibacter sp. RFBG4]|nr:hypothetical protein [Pseudoclavibacter sp. RFBG4]